MWKMRTRSLIIAVLMFFSFKAAYADGETIYVDGSVAESGNGTSWAEAFKTLSEGVNALVAANAIKQGGHTILIAEGTYTMNAAPETATQVDLNSAHTGVAGAMNVFRAEGNITVGRSGAGRTFWFQGASYIHLDGLRITGQGRNGQVSFWSGTSGNLIENCNFVGGEEQIRSQAGSFTVRNSSFSGAGRNASIEQRSSATITIENCLFWRNRTAVWSRSGSGTINISDSIIALNRSYGLLIDDTGASVNAERTLFYANGLVNAYFASTGKAYDTEADFAELSQQPNMNFIDIIVSNPGFADLHNNWDQTLFYDNSPVLMENSGFASHLGPDQDLQTVPASENTYYVNSVGGDDGRTPAQAQNENTPWLTIAKAAEHAIAGDTVIVKPGHYSGNVTITSSGSGELPLTFKADAEVFFESQLELNRTAGVVVDGLDFDTGRILLNSAYGTKILNCRIYGRNQAGISASGSVRTTVRDTVIHSCQYGIFHGDSGLIVERCRIYSNSLNNVYADEAVRIVNSALFDNGSGANITLRHPAGFRPFPHHSSLVENSVLAGSPGAGIHDYKHNSGSNADLHIVNTIVMGNQTGAYLQKQSAAYAGSETIILRHSCFHDNQNNFSDFGTFYNTATELNSFGNNESNIVADPEFRNMFYADFRLAQDSPCIDAGTAETELGTDMFGNPRLIGPAVDIGVYEMPYAGSVMRFF